MPPAQPHSAPLPPAIAEGKAKLSQEARDEILALGGPRPVQYFTQALLAWVVICGAIYASERIDTWWATIAAWLLIASRMNILGLLVHEQAHFLGMRGRWADTLTNLLTAYPLLAITVEGYAKVHLSHHKWYFTDQDPDLKRKSGPDWTFPMSGWRLARLFLSDLTGLSMTKLVQGKRLDTEHFRRPQATPGWVRPLFLIALLAGVTWAGVWHQFLLYWVVPMIFILPAIVRLGAITEHVYIPGGGVAETSPLVIQRWYEKVLLPNLNFAMHPYHHWHPGVAFCHLPDVHRIYQREGLVNDKHVFHGYIHYIRHLQSAAARLEPAVALHDVT